MSTPMAGGGGVGGSEEGHFEVDYLKSLPPCHPHLVDAIVTQIKSQGLFDEFRKTCLADIDTKSSYLNLKQRVEGYVSAFLQRQQWSSVLQKNQLREALRKDINESGLLKSGLDHLVDQLVFSRVERFIRPKVQAEIADFLGIVEAPPPPPPPPPPPAVPPGHGLQVALPPHNFSVPPPNYVAPPPGLPPLPPVPPPPEVPGLEMSSDTNRNGLDVERADSRPPEPPSPHGSDYSVDMSDSSMVGRDEVVGDFSAHLTAVGCYPESISRPVAVESEQGEEVIQEQIVLLEGEEISNSPLSNALLEDDEEDAGASTEDAAHQSPTEHNKNNRSEVDCNSSSMNYQGELSTTGGVLSVEYKTRISSRTATDNEANIEKQSEEVFEELSEGGVSELIGEEDVGEGTPVEDEMENNAFSPSRSPRIENLNERPFSRTTEEGYNETRTDFRGLFPAGNPVSDTEPAPPGVDDVPIPTSPYTDGNNTVDDSRMVIDEGTLASSSVNIHKNVVEEDDMELVSDEELHDDVEGGVTPTVDEPQEEQPKESGVDGKLPNHEQESVNISPNKAEILSELRAELQGSTEMVDSVDSLINNCSSKNKGASDSPMGQPMSPARHDDELEKRSENAGGTPPRTASPAEMSTATAVVSTTDVEGQNPSEDVNETLGKNSSEVNPLTCQNSEEPEADTKPETGVLQKAEDASVESASSGDIIGDDCVSSIESRELIDSEDKESGALPRTPLGPPIDENTHPPGTSNEDICFSEMEKNKLLESMTDPTNDEAMETVHSKLQQQTEILAADRVREEQGENCSEPFQRVHPTSMISEVSVQSSKSEDEADSNPPNDDQNELNLKSKMNELMESSQIEEYSEIQTTTNTSENKSVPKSERERPTVDSNSTSSGHHKSTQRTNDRHSRDRRHSLSQSVSSRRNSGHKNDSKDKESKDRDDRSRKSSSSVDHRDKDKETNQRTNKDKEREDRDKLREKDKARDKNRSEDKNKERSHRSRESGKDRKSSKDDRKQTTSSSSSRHHHHHHHHYHESRRDADRSKRHHDSSRDRKRQPEGDKPKIEKPQNNSEDTKRQSEHVDSSKARGNSIPLCNLKNEEEVPGLSKQWNDLDNGEKAQHMDSTEINIGEALLSRVHPTSLEDNTLKIVEAEDGTNKRLRLDAADEDATLLRPEKISSFNADNKATLDATEEPQRFERTEVNEDSSLADTTLREKRDHNDDGEMRKKGELDIDITQQETNTSVSSDDKDNQLVIDEPDGGGGGAAVDDDDDDDGDDMSTDLQIDFDSSSRKRRRKPSGETGNSSGSKVKKGRKTSNVSDDKMRPLQPAEGVTNISKETIRKGRRKSSTASPQQQQMTVAVEEPPSLEGAPDPPVSSRGRQRKINPKYIDDGDVAAMFYRKKR